MKYKKPLLTISLLISNRPDTIPRCLDSLKLLMDVLPCELILIDTSKNKEIHEMLLKYTNQVYEFEWCKDFAKARNEGVKRAKGKWFLYLDDDEWLVDVEPIVKFFQTGTYKKYECANIQVRNYADPEYKEYMDAWVTRLFYLEKGAKFEGRIHEYIYPIYGEPAFLQGVIHHSGYIFETEEKRRRHFERNSQLLLELVEEEPTRLRWQAQLVQEYRSVEEWELMTTFCQTHLKAVKKVDDFMDRNHFCTLYAGLVEGLMGLKRHRESIEICKQALEDERSTELLKALMHIKIAQNCVDLGEWDAAKEQVGKYLEYYQTYSKNEKIMSEQRGSLLVHAVFEKEYMDVAYNILIYAELRKENLDSGEVEEEHQELKEIDAFSGIRFVKYMVKLMATMEYKDVFARFLTNACQDETLCNWVCAEAQQWEKEDTEGFRKIAYALAQVESDFWFIGYCRVITADEQKNKKAVKKAVEELIQSLPNVFYLPDKIYDIIDKYDIKIALVWDQVAADVWEIQIGHFVHTSKEKYVDKVNSLLKNVFRKDDWHIVSLELARVEKEIMMGPCLNVMEYDDLLKEYAQKKMQFYCKRHKEDMQNLPPEVQAAIKISEYAELESKDKKMAFSKLKEVVDVCPAFAKGIGQLFRLYAELERQKAEKQKREMLELRNQVMGQVNMMLASGQTQAAMQIVGQLKQMFPEDLEVAALGLEVRLKTLA